MCLSVECWNRVRERKHMIPATERSEAVLEWRSGGVEEWRSRGVEEWKSGGVEGWRRGGVEEVRS